MKYLFNLHLSVAPEEIDLQDYGHEEHVYWEDLNEDEKNEITDLLRERAMSDIGVDDPRKID